MNRATPIIMCLFLLISVFADAQQTIKGRVVSKQTKEDLPFANIVVKGVSVDTLFGQMAKLNGTFAIKRVPKGIYNVTISVIGYKKEIKTDVTIEDKTIDLGKIMLSESAVKLDEVEIVAEKSYIETKAGKRIINVQKDIINSGGSAVEILSMAPSVEVGIAGEISIRGEDDVFVLINGKETALSFLGAAQALKQIPASSIEKIEIITNAGAEHGPDGEGGMINVILKKEKRNGTEVTLGGDMSLLPLSASGTAGIQYKHNKIGFNLNYSVEKSKSESETSSERYYKTIVNGNKRLTDHTKSKGDGLSHFIMGGTTYAISDSSELSLSLYYENGKENSDINQSYITTRTDNTVANSSIKGDSENKESFGGVELSYNTMFSKEKTLEVSANLFKGTMWSSTANKTINNNKTDFDKSVVDNTFSSIDANINYEMPVTDFVGLKAGLESSYLTFDASQIITNNSLGTNNKYTFNQNKNSLFVVSNWQIGFAELGLGARLEAYNSRGDHKGGKHFGQDYVNIYPNVQLTTGFPLFGVENGIMFSYSKRINRPEYEQLNPTIDYSNKLDISKGNPDLKPEFAHVFELTHEVSGGKLNIATTLFHRITTNVIQAKKELRPNNVVLTTYANESNRSNTGVELYMKYNVTNWLDISNDFTVFNKHFKVDANTGKSKSVNWYSKLMANIRPGAGFKIQVNMRYIGKQSGLYYTTDPYYGMGLGVSKDIMSGKGKIILGVSDIFNSIKLKSTSTQDSFIQHTNTKYNTRMVKFGFLFNFR